jgi:hypothetical protein
VVGANFLSPLILYIFQSTYVRQFLTNFGLLVRYGIFTVRLFLVFVRGLRSAYSVAALLLVGTRHEIPVLRFDLGGVTPVEPGVFETSTNCIQQSTGFWSSFSSVIGAAFYGVSGSAVSLVSSGAILSVVPFVVVGLGVVIFYTTIQINYETLVMLKAPYSVYGETWLENDDMSNVQNPRPYAEERIFKAVRKINEKRDTFMNTPTTTPTASIVDTGR